MGPKVGARLARAKMLRGAHTKLLRGAHAKPPRGAPSASQTQAVGAVEALYLQVARTLKEEIVTGVYPVGSQLPTEDALCSRFSVSRYTVREALRRLREDNLVSSRQGSGTVVVARRTSDSYAGDVMSINDLVSWSVGKRFAIEFMEMIALDEKLAARTGLASGDEWLAVRGFGHEDGVKVPVCWAEYFIHRDFAAVGRLLPRHSGPIFPLIEDLFGQKIVEVQQQIGATLVSSAVAGSLQVKAGSAALEVRRTYKTAANIAQVTLSTHPASRYRHSMTLRRVKC
jgi:GntR family transcriptional regulator